MMAVVVVIAVVLAVFVAASLKRKPRRRLHTPQRRKSRSEETECRRVHMATNKCMESTIGTLCCMCSQPAAWQSRLRGSFERHDRLLPCDGWPTDSCSSDHSMQRMALERLRSWACDNSHSTHNNSTPLQTAPNFSHPPPNATNARTIASCKQLQHSHMRAHVHSCTRSHQEGGARSRCSKVNGDVGDDSASSECVRVPRQSQHCIRWLAGEQGGTAAANQHVNTTTCA